MMRLYDYIQSELIKKGLNEFTDEEDNLIFFNENAQFMTKIFQYDEDIKEIVDDLFLNYQLDNPENDEHFKKTFLFRFINRKINRQTMESFKLELVNTFLTNQFFINKVYNELDEYLTGVSTNEQINNQETDGQTINDSRNAHSELPQSTVNLDVENHLMESANTNTVSINKQTNQQESTGTTTNESRNKQLDQLLKTNNIFESIFKEFDKKCFSQIF